MSEPNKLRDAVTEYRRGVAEERGRIRARVRRQLADSDTTTDYGCGLIDAREDLLAWLDAEQENGK